jgi:hypothetical protein
MSRGINFPRQDLPRIKLSRIECSTQLFRKIDVPRFNVPRIICSADYVFRGFRGLYVPQVESSYDQLKLRPCDVASIMYLTLILGGCGC